MINCGRFFFIIVIFIINYCFLIPRKEDVFSKYYTYGIFLIIYAVIIVFSLKNIDIKKVSKKKRGIAIIAGILGSMVTTIPWMGILTGICTFFACLYGFYINIVYEIGKTRDRNYILDNFKIIFEGLIFYMIILYFKLLSEKAIDSSASIGITNFTAIGAGVSEEMIFRWFLPAFMLQINKGEEVSSFLYYSMVTVPFALLHVIDMVVWQGITMEAFFYVISTLMIALLLAVLAKKRDVSVAIVFHFIFDFIRII